DFIGIGDTALTGVPATGNQVGTAAAPLNPLLGPLQNNGGPLAGAPGLAQVVPTEAPLPGSLVIDKGNNGAVVDQTDERGQARIFNVVDAGAVESTLAPAATNPFAVPPGTDVTAKFQISAMTTRVKKSRTMKRVTQTAVNTTGFDSGPVTGNLTFSIKVGRRRRMVTRSMTLPNVAAGATGTFQFNVNTGGGMLMLDSFTITKG